MKKEILFLILLIMNLTFVVAQTDFMTYYKLNLDYDKENINISSVEIEFSQEEIENFFGFYVAEVLDYNDEILNLTFFEVPKDILWDGINPETGEIDRGGEMELEQVSFEIYVPYYENAKEIIIYDEDFAELASEDISQYSKQRPDEEAIGEDLDEEDIQKKEIQKENITEYLGDYWWVLLVVLFILIIILFYSLRKRKR